ncbi:hypothetical protein [Limnohabitans sp. 2KL-17]|uniref:hypothetical protein n=1 Tax=Limnohabitans sp. 2KL-17 TaxID=1100704 RepID=UPI0011B258DF|nr:hypothetical protein [Limnohabitans sp. 2KL-17]
MFRRDKTPLSGALHRLFQRCFEAPAPVRGWANYCTGWGVGVAGIRTGEGIAASNPPGHRWRRASAALDHAAGQAVATSSRTRSTPHSARLIRGRVLPLPLPLPLALGVAVPLCHRTAPHRTAAPAPASNPPGHRWRRASPALDHATGRALATSEPH